LWSKPSPRCIVPVTTHFGFNPVHDTRTRFKRVWKIRANTVFTHVVTRSRSEHGTPCVQHIQAKASGACYASHDTSFRRNGNTRRVCNCYWHARFVDVVYSTGTRRRHWRSWTGWTWTRKSLATKKWLGNSVSRRRTFRVDSPGGSGLSPSCGPCSTNRTRRTPLR